MKRLLSLLALIILYNTLCAQTTVVQSIQVKTAQGAPPQQSMPTNGGLAYYDATGLIKKADLKFILGKKVDSVLKLNDSTIQVVSQFGNTYNVTIRGLYDLSTKGFVDSLRAGQKKDTTIVKNLGIGAVRLASVNATRDSLQVSTLRDSSDIGWVKYGDSTVVPILKPSGVSAGTYGDSTKIPQIQVDANGRIKSITEKTAPAGGGGGPGNTNISISAGTDADSVKSSTGTGALIPAAIAGVSAGVTTASKQARYDSLVNVNNSGHGKPLLRAPYTRDSLICRGVTVTASGRVVSTYTGNNDSVSYNITLVNISHTIFTPTTGQTVTLAGANRNIINPAGTIAALTLTLPSSPANNDEVTMKFTQAVTAITWTAGTVVGGSSGAAAGATITLTYDSATTSWY